MSTSQKIEPSILAWLILIIGATILNQKQEKEDPELLDKIQKFLDESKEKGGEK